MSDEKKPLPPWVRLQTLPPKDAVEWFRSKGLKKSFRWTDVWEAEHAHAFTVAGMMKADLLSTVKQKLEAAISEGKTLADFEKELTPELIKAGWWGKGEITDDTTGEVRTAQLGSPSRIKLIFDTNVRMAHSAGTWARSEATKATAPFVMYRTMRDERVRADHRSWDGLVLPRDDSFWDTHWPPNGFNCRCVAIPISQDGIDDLRAAGKRIKTDPPEITTETWERNGQEITTHTGVDPGFGYNPGKAREKSLEKTIELKREAWPKDIQDAYDALVKKQPGGKK